MTNEHYSKYKETIKKVARRNYRKRVAWLNNHLAAEYVNTVVKVKLYVLNYIPMMLKFVNKPNVLV